MKLETKRLINKSIALAALFCMTTQSTLAAVITFANTPLFIGATIPPQVMLTISKDQQLHYKAYTDYTDLDGDGLLEITYKHSITYYGYFDPIKCYSYDTTIAAGSGGPRFVPIAVSPGNNKLCDTVAGGRWSGNFLNWISMSRLDTVRKLLYGGFRSSDTGTLSVLERSVVPHDAHAWAKYYNGDGSTADRPLISALTPHNPPTTPPTGIATGPANLVAGTLNFTAVEKSVCLGDQVKVAVNASNYVVGRVSVVNTGDCSTAATGTFSVVVDASSGIVVAGAIVGGGNIVGAVTAGFYTVSNLSGTGISFCNVTAKSTGAVASGNSHTSTDPPLIRVAQGNFAMWGNNDLIQCQWNPGGRTFGGTGSNGNIGTLSGRATDPAGTPNWGATQEPLRTTHGLLSGGATGTQDMIARVEVCKTSLLGSEKCKQYNTANVYKPIGLLQDYGDPGLIHFGLLTGTYDANKSGGVLRKNVGPLGSGAGSEIAADGTFVTPAGGSVIGTLNKLKMYGYAYNAAGGDYGSDGCGVVTSGSGTAALNRGDAEEGRCTNWGDPIAELYLESVRYFVGAGGGAAPTAAFTAVPNPAGTTNNRDTTVMGLTKATWTDPLSNSNFCAPLNVVVFNPGFSTFDRDQLGGVSNLGGVGANTAVTLTNAVGGHEGINGTSVFVGNSAADTNALCTAKTGVNLGEIYGLCPQSPRGQGSFLVAGIAHQARTNRIRSDLTVPLSDVKSLKVATYGIAAAASPNIIIPVGTNTVTLMPSARVRDAQVTFGSGGLVDFKVIYQTATEGKFFVQWEVSQQGADYDLDLWGVIGYTIAGSTITVTTDVISANPSGDIGFGYIINGTTKDGAHYHSGYNNFSYTDPQNVTVVGPHPTTGVVGNLNGVVNSQINASGGCTNCATSAPPTSVAYTAGTSSAGLLKDPLWYAAKYGGFTDSNANGIPDVQSEWDNRLSNGQPGQDGIPDNFFLVSNPLGLEAALDRVFVSILSAASASSVATNSTSLQTGTTIYQARFNANDWSGQVLAFPVNAQGQIATTPSWDAGQVINGQNHNTGRNVFTYNDTATVRDGIRFRWPASPTFNPDGTVVPGSLAANELSPTLVNALNISPGTTTSDSRGSERVNWLRGDPSSEGTSVTGFRARPVSRLGDIINSNPNFVAAPNAGHVEQNYAQFRQDNLTRPAMIYVGGNDGMLHGFRASDGVETLAYIPSKVHSRLNQLTSKTYVGSSHRWYVDGSPEIADAFFGTTWHTVLVSGLGAGGQGIFALDITKPVEFAETDTKAGEIVLWEFNDSDDPDLGFVVGQPAIRKMANGKWAAIISGGYNNSVAETGELACTDSTTRTPAGCTTSSTKSAYVYIIYLSGPTGANRTWQEGTDYIKIRAQRASDATLGPNGLSQPLAADVNADGVVDFIYAGDLRGRLWKFDVRSATAADWKLDASRVVLFIAEDNSGNRQAITAKPEGTLHPNGGFIITFGTGKYMETTDPDPAGYRTESFYGIWDKNDRNPIGPIGGSTAQTQVIARSGGVSGRDQLLEQTITNVTSGSNTFRVVSTNQPIWSVDDPPEANDAPTKHMGWYMDFPSSTTTGERSVFRPILTAGRLIFTTLIPSVAACAFGGTSFLMVVDPTTGARIDGAVLDTSGDGTLNSSDQISYGTGMVYASGVQSTIGITPTPTIIKTSGGSTSGSGDASSQIFGTTGPLVAGAGFLLAYALAAGSSGGNASTMIGLSAAGGRVSWRELMSE